MSSSTLKFEVYSKKCIKEIQLLIIEPHQISSLNTWDSNAALKENNYIHVFIQREGH